MRLIDELRAEHDLVDRVAGSLLAWDELRERGEASADEAAAYARVLTVLVCAWHLGREEGLLEALVRRAEVPGDRGPIPVLRGEHREIAELTGLLGQTRDGEPGSVRRLVHLLWEHIDKVRSVLLPEAKVRLARAAVRELPGTVPDGDTHAAFELARDLVVRHPPVDDPEVIRGDGCICCSAFAIRCGGIESEWWTTWERLHHRSLDEG